MRFIFLREIDKIQKSKIVHIIEHEGYGTLHQLIEPLQEDLNQHVICTYNLTSMKFVCEDVHYIIHTTGHLYPIISNIKLLLENGVRVSVFLHVAPKYFELKQKCFFLDYISNVQLEYGLECFCPSNEVALQYRKIGLKVKFIQVGFPNIDTIVNQNRLFLDAYCNKYVTVCTNSDPRYIHLKGINEFVDIIEENNLNDKALILGFDGKYRGIRCKKLNLDDFLYVLRNSKVYIQLSVTEAYNLTALQAKKLKVPVIVSDVDGHKDCMKNICNRYNFEEDLNEKIKLASGNACLESNYIDSIERETTENFILSIKTNLFGGNVNE